MYQVKQLIKQVLNIVNIRNFIALFAVMYLIVTYHSTYMTWYDNNVIPILSHFKSNFLIATLIIIILIVIGYDIFIKYKLRYRYRNGFSSMLLLISIMLLECRFSGKYDYVYWIYKISYVDTIIAVCVFYFIAALINICRQYYHIYQKHQNPQTGIIKASILNDSPIENKNDDIFDFVEEIDKLANKIKILDNSKTWSIAITAPWGGGKTSFVNLIKEQISNSDFEIVYFRPRDSKSFHVIQEDFFTTISCVLAKYDARCNKILKDYMASLQLIDNRGVVEKIINTYKIWDKDSLKSSIEQTFADLDIKVLVIIDDFDRLSKDEIIEVLKLIDSNAAFTNLIFLTAYDKEQVNKVLGDSYKTKDACFVDKFFNLEYTIPSRPYAYISKYIEDSLCNILNTDAKEAKDIQVALTNRQSIFQEYIPTLRDAKRYINQITIDYKRVRGDVVIEEYMLVQLIKYRYPELYKELYKQKYLEQGNLFSANEILYLKKDLSDNIAILPILNILFPTDKNNVNKSYRHVYNIKSFDNYFVNQIYSCLRIGDMQKLFLLAWKEVLVKIDNWAASEREAIDFIEYLDSLDMDTFPSGSIYTRYAEMVAYTACRLPYSRAFWLFMRTINIKNIEHYDKKYNLDFNAYKSRLIDIIKVNDPLCRLITSLHIEYKTYRLNEDDELIKDDDVWPYIKSQFINATDDPDMDDKSLLDWLHKCIDNMESQSRLCRLDTDCLKAYRKRIEDTPSAYIKHFVFLGGVSSNPDFNTIACEPFWEQIFENKAQFEAFLSQCKAKNVEGSIIAWNFWQLYKENDFKPIQYNGQGPVQEKIDNMLAEEIRKLDAMTQIEREILAIPNEMQSMSIDSKDEYINILTQKNEELDKINLYIALNGKIRSSIQHKIETISQIK